MERRENFLLHGRLSVLALISVSVPPPSPSAIACKRTRSFCQKCRWQVTATYACTLHMWLCMKPTWCMVCKVYTERAEMAAVSRGTSHVSAVSTLLGWIFKNALEKASHSCRITCKRSESARERGIALCKSEQRQQQLTAGVFITQLAEREKPGAILTRVRVRGAARDFFLSDTVSFQCRLSYGAMTTTINSGHIYNSVGRA